MVKKKILLFVLLVTGTLLSCGGGHSHGDRYGIGINANREYYDEEETRIESVESERDVKRLISDTRKCVSRAYRLVDKVENGSVDPESFVDEFLDISMKLSQYSDLLSEAHNKGLISDRDMEELQKEMAKLLILMGALSE